MSMQSTVHQVPASEAVVERIAKCEGVEPTELPPLYETVDPDALNSLVSHARGGKATLRLRFRYFSYEVTVTEEGVIHLDEVETSPQTNE